MNDNITPYVRYIGADDKDLDLFESQYVVPQGISYNSYVITDEKIAVMDTIDQRKTEEWTVRLEEALEGRTPDYLIVQHMEPDHAANIGWFAEKYPEATIVASAKAIQMMPQFFEEVNFAGRTQTVKEGDTLCLGQHTLKFIMAPMVHWPEVMLTYEESEKILFSADAFGKFGALCHEGEWIDEARRYYFNIVGIRGASTGFAEESRRSGHRHDLSAPRACLERKLRVLHRALRYLEQIRTGNGRSCRGLCLHTWKYGCRRTPDG